MITRPLIVTAVAAVAVAGTASAAALTISSEPTLANIVVTVPACDDPTPSSVPITWSPARDCAPATEVTPVRVHTSDPAPQADAPGGTSETEATESAHEPAAPPDAAPEADQPQPAGPQTDGPQTSAPAEDEPESLGADLVQPVDAAAQADLEVGTGA
jgi:hypothetical protein